MPCHKATFIYTKAVIGNSCCLLLRSEDVSEELSEEESRIMQRVQRPALEMLEDVLRKDQVLTPNSKVVVVLAREGKGWAYLTEMLLRCLISQIRQMAFWKKPRKPRSYAYRKIKVILEEQE